MKRGWAIPGCNYFVVLPPSCPPSDSLHHTLATFLPRYLLDLSPTLGETYGAAVPDSFLTFGGDLLIFAGDAILARFPAQSEGQDARWATWTALRLGGEL